MSIRMFFVLGLIETTFSACGPGCLRCSSGGNCILCDSTRGFSLLSSGTCGTSIPSNCERPGFDGACLECAPGYILGSGGMRCEKPSNPIAGCYRYASTTICKICEKGKYFSVSSFKCETVTKTVTGCIYYVGDAACGTCDTGQVPSFAGQRCLSADSSCKVASPVSCISCSTGFFRNANLFLSAVASNNPPALARVTKNGETALGSWPVCEVSPLRNCATAETANRCAKCKSGYFLSERGDCVVFPSPATPFCLRYSSLTTCAECAGGYYLASESQCATITPISHCARYVGSARSTVCAACEVSYFLTQNNCEPRVAKPANCATPSVNSDTCGECKPGFQLQEGRCLTSISGCALYGPDGNCAGCSAGLWLSSSGGCLQGSIADCIEYTGEAAEAKCVKCSTQAYLDPILGLCTRHQPIPNCLVYDPLIFGTCIECSSTSLDFTVLNGCARVTPIPHCTSYPTPTSCGACEEKFFLLSGRCESIAIERCLEVDTNKACVRCESGFFVSQGVCYQVEALVSTFCEVVDAGQIVGSPASQTPRCLGCIEGSVQMVVAGPVCRDRTFFFRNPSSGPREVEFCLVYGETGGCLACQTGKFVATGGGSCVSSTECINGKLSLAVDVANGRVKGVGRDVCVTGSGSLCSVWTLREDGIRVCGQCQSGTYATSDFISPFSFSDGVEEMGPTARVPAITSCVSSVASATPNNCPWYSISAGSYYCARCPWGYTGTATAGSGSARSYFGTGACSSTVTYCDTNIKLQGVSAVVTSVFTCYGCTTGFPVANVYVVTGGYAPKPGVAAMVCSLKPSIVNCLLYVNEYATSAASTFVLKCVTCQSGWTPASDGSTCVPIDGCDPLPENSWPNSCQSCLTGRATLISAPFAACVASPAARNCVLLSSDAGSCEVCAVGYSKNLDNRCESIRTPRCLQENLGHVFPAPLAALAAARWVALSQRGINGCWHCAPRQVAVASSASVCVPSTVAVAGSISGSVLPSNCASFAFDSVPKCLRCKQGFVVTQDGARCVDATGLTNCKQVDAAGTRCILCVDNFSLISGACVQPTAANCVEFASPADSVSCVRCAMGYSLVGGVCEEGKVENCIEFGGSVDTCMTCSSGYHLLESTGSEVKTVCFPLSSWLNCTSFEPDSFQRKQLRCEVCANGYSLVDVATFAEICLAIPMVPGCARYSRKSPIDPSSLDCVECQSGYYLSQTVCIRSSPVANCVVYHGERDACISCADGFFASLVGDACIGYPTGVPGCAEYSSASTCTSCNSTTFLKSNACVPVSTDKVVANCLSYGDSESRCVQCKPGYLLSGRSCVAGSVENCAVLTSATKCSTCLSGFYLSAAGASCLSLPDPSCEAIADGACVSCPPERVPSGLTCATATTPIEGCLLYSSSSACKRCISGTALSPDGSTCSKELSEFIDPNCADSRQLDSVTCSICATGSYFADGACQTCPSTLGCAQCSSNNQTVCLVCSSGFYMDATGICIAEVSPIQPGCGEGQVCQSTIPFCMIFFTLFTLLLS